MQPAPPGDTQDRGKDRSPVGLPPRSVGQQSSTSQTLSSAWVSAPQWGQPGCPPCTGMLWLRTGPLPGWAALGGQPGLHRLPAGAGRESRLLHGDRGAQPCVQKYLYCSLRLPAAPRAPGCLAVLVPAPTAQLSRSGSRAAPAQPRARCHREQSCGAGPATDTG